MSANLLWVLSMLGHACTDHIYQTFQKVAWTKRRCLIQCVMCTHQWVDIHKQDFYLCRLLSRHVCSVSFYIAQDCFRLWGLSHFPSSESWLQLVLIQRLCECVWQTHCYREHQGQLSQVLLVEHISEPLCVCVCVCVCEHSCLRICMHEYVYVYIIIYNYVNKNVFLH